MNRIPPTRNRIPIQGIQRQSIIASDVLLEQDSKQSQSNLEDLFEDLSEFSLSADDKRVMIEDAFTSKFPSLWALKYKTIKGKPTTYKSKNPFKHRPWQQQILDDDHPNKVVEKSRQLGLSEVGMTEVLHFLINNEATKSTYIFPRNQQVVDFSKSRISPVFQNNQYFEPLIDKATNSVTTKKILDSYLFLRSGWSGALGEGADIDILALDEYDRMKEGVEFSFQEGLKSSKYGLMRRWSTPTIPGRGINALYQKSDQMRYVWTCEHCGLEQFLTFDDNLIQIKPHGVNNVTQEIEDDTFIIGCKSCKHELNRMGEGKWVPMYPNIRELRGYHISQLDAAWISADDIMRRKFNYTSKQLFYNYVVGEPYASEGLVVTDEDIKSAIRLPKEVMSKNANYIAVSAGIDWGEVSYMTLLGIKANGAVDLLNIFTVQDDPKQPLRSASFFASVLRAYQPNVIIADFGYGADRNSYLYTQYPSAFYSCFWKTSKNPLTNTQFKAQYNENAHQVTVDKTVTIQRMLHSLKGKLIGLFPWCEKIEMLTKHIKNTRIMDAEADGVVYQTATRVGADHTACALAYAMVGVDKLTEYNIKFNSSSSKIEFI